MGIIRAVARTISGGLADQWLTVIEPDGMDAGTVFTTGVPVRQDGAGTHAKTQDHIADGSVIHVYDNQFMMLVDGGKIVDYTAEPGYFQVNGKAAPSLFTGTLDESVKDSVSRFAFGGASHGKQMAYYVNLQEIRGLKFGTRTPVSYYDSFYKSELFLRLHGTYSIKITDPVKFYREVVARNAYRVNMDQVNEQYLNEFMVALQTVINKLSHEGMRISHFASRSRELSRYMSVTLDEYWQRLRGMEICSVAISGISYTEESERLIYMRSQGAMLSDTDIRNGYVQSTLARDMKSPGGPVSSGPWQCQCGWSNPDYARFCPHCGQGNPAVFTCAHCGHSMDAAYVFCPQCGTKTGVA